MLHLLPQNHKKIVLKEYRKRLLIVISISVICICVSGIIFLLPSYIFSKLRYQDVNDRENAIQASILASQKSVDASVANKISQGIAVLKPLGATSPSTDFSPMCRAET